MEKEEISHCIIQDYLMPCLRIINDISILSRGKTKMEIGYLSPILYKVKKIHLFYNTRKF